MQREKNVIDFIDNKMKLSLTSILNINLGSDPYISNIQCFVVRTMSNMKKIKRNRSNHAMNWNKGAIKKSYCRHFTRIQITFLTAHFPIYHVGMYAYSCAKRKCDLFFLFRLINLSNLVQAIYGKGANQKCMVAFVHFIVRYRL